MTDYQSGTYSWGMMDDLSYSYLGNQLSYVTDAGANTGSGKDYKDNLSLPAYTLALQVPIDIYTMPMAI